MRYRLDLLLKDNEGALARVLDAVERNGFRARSIDGEAGPHAGTPWRVALVVEGERSDANLCKQIAKLWDCDDASVCQSN